MRKITRNGVEILSKEESEHIYNLVYDELSEDFHYLAFDRQLNSFSPLGVYTSRFPALMENENEIIAALVDHQEVESLYPVAKLSLYPVTKIVDARYSLDLDNCEKHFADILKLNDTVYSTKYLFVDFGHVADNFDEVLLIKHLSELLSKSNLLEVVYLQGPEW